MAERLIVFLNQYALPEELHPENDSFTIGKITIHQGAVLDNNGIDLSNKNLTNVQDINFNSDTGKIAGIENKNLLDRTKNEEITGVYTFNGVRTLFTGDIHFPSYDSKFWVGDGGNRFFKDLISKAVDEVINGRWHFENGFSAFDDAYLNTIKFKDLLDRTKNEEITGNWTFNDNINLNANPVNSNNVVNKLYVDTVAQGLTLKAPVSAASVVNLDVIYDNGNNGVGATLTSVANEVLQLDGYVVPLNSRVLIKNQVDKKQNGIYVLTQIGSSTSKWVLTRAEDFDGSPSSEAVSGSFVFVVNGISQKSTGWVVSCLSETIRFGVDNLDWIMFSKANDYLAGFGLVLDGAVFKVNTSEIIDTNYALIDSGTLENKKIRVNVDSNGAIVFDTVSKGLKVNTDNLTIGVTDNKLKVNPNSIGASEVKLDDNFDWSGRQNFSNSQFILPLQQPSVNLNGCVYWDTTQNKLFVYSNDSSKWVNISEGGSFDAVSQGNFLENSFVYVSGNGYVDVTTANNDNALKLVGCVEKNTTASQVCSVKFQGVKRGFTGLVAGSSYYLSSTVAGGITTDLPSGAGQYIIKVGIAISSTELLVNIEFLGRRRVI